MASTMNLGTLTAFARIDTGGVRSGARVFESSMARMASAAAAFAGTAVAIRSTIGRYAELESTLTKAAARSGGAGTLAAKYGELEATARELGRTTAFTSNEVAGGMLQFAKAGFEATKTVEAMPAALRLAQSTASDLGSASDTVTNIMASMGLEAKDLTSVVDQLTAAVNGARIDLADLNVGFAKVGATARAVGYGVDDVTVGMASLTNQGTEAGEAARGLRRILTGIIAPTKDGAKGLRELGISTADLNGDITTLIRKLADARESMGGNKFAATAQKAFDIFGATAANALANAADGADKLKESLAGSDGLASAIQAAELQTLSGRIDLATSAFSGFAEVIGREANPFAKGFVDLLTQVANIGTSVATSLANALRPFLQDGGAVLAIVTGLATGLAGVTMIAGPMAVAFGQALITIGAVVTLLGIVANRASEYTDKLSALGKEFKYFFSTIATQIALIIKKPFAVLASIVAPFLRALAAVEAKLEPILGKTRAFGQAADMLEDAAVRSLEGELGSGGLLSVENIELGRQAIKRMGDDLKDTFTGAMQEAADGWQKIFDRMGLKVNFDFQMPNVPTPIAAPTGSPGGAGEGAGSGGAGPSPANIYVGDRPPSPADEQGPGMSQAERKDLVTGLLSSLITGGGAVEIASMIGNKLLPGIGGALGAVAGTVAETLSLLHPVNLGLRIMGAGLDALQELLGAGLDALQDLWGRTRTASRMQEKSNAVLDKFAEILSQFVAPFEGVLDAALIFAEGIARAAVPLGNFSVIAELATQTFVLAARNMIMYGRAIATITAALTGNDRMLRALEDADQALHDFAIGARVGHDAMLDAADGARSLSQELFNLSDSPGFRRMRYGAETPAPAAGLSPRARRAVIQGGLPIPANKWAAASAFGGAN